MSASSRRSESSCESGWGWRDGKFALTDRLQSDNPIVNFSPLPTIPGYTWRALTPADIPALICFELACSRVDGATNLTGEAEWVEKLKNAVDSVVASNVNGEIAAAGSIEDAPGAGTERAFLDGRVHPDFRGRGIGSALLGWMEARADAHLLAKDNELPKVLRIMFWDRADDATALFEQHGFEFHYIEEEMRVDLQQPRPDLPLPSGLSVELWSPGNAPDFYTIYRGAYGTRTDNPLSESAWTQYWANPDDPEFRSDLTFLVRDGEEPVAFSVGHVYETDVASVGQFGVRPAWRGRGVGTAVLVEALNRFAAEGYRYGTLTVNINNPNARRLYERAGLRLTKRFTMYRKIVG